MMVQGFLRDKFYDSEFKLGDTFLISLGKSGVEVKAVVVGIQRVFNRAWYYKLEANGLYNDGRKIQRVFNEFQLRKLPKID